MLESCFTPYRFNNEYLRRQLTSVDRDKATHVPHTGVKTPLWIVGHLGAGAFYIGAMLGKPVCPAYDADWLQFFGPGTDAENVSSDAPSIDTLADVLLDCEQTVFDEVAAANESDYGDPHGLELLNDTPLKTKADLIAHLMTTHYATHLGELAIWRRVMGIPPLF